MASDADQVDRNAVPIFDGPRSELGKRIAAIAITLRTAPRPQETRLELLRARKFWKPYREAAAARQKKREADRAPYASPAATQEHETDVDENQLTFGF